MNFSGFTFALLLFASARFAQYRICPNISLRWFIPPLLLGCTPNFLSGAGLANKWLVYVVAERHKIRSAVAICWTKIGWVNPNLLVYQELLLRSICFIGFVRSDELGLKLCRRIIPCIRALFRAVSFDFSSTLLGALHEWIACLRQCNETVSLTPKFRGARLAWPKRALVEASPATPS